SETFVSFRGHLVEVLRASDIAVSYVGPAVDAATRAWLDARSVRVHEISLTRNTVAPFADLRSLFSLWRALRSIAPQAVITMRIKSTVYGLLAAAIARIPYRFVFVTGLGYAFTEQPGRWRWKVTNKIARVLYD